MTTTTTAPKSLNLINAIACVEAAQAAISTPRPMTMVEIHDAASVLSRGVAHLNASSDGTPDVFAAVLRCATALRMRAQLC